MAIRGITIHEILNQLGCRTPHSASGVYKCHCPVHDDKKASLTVSEGDKGILIRCLSGKCTLEQICARLGMEVKDLFFETPEAKTAKPGQAVTARKPPKEYSSVTDAFGHLGKVVREYPYTTEDGRLVFTVARIRTPDGDKTFRQFRPAHPEKGPIPFICSVPAEISAGLIYHLPRVRTAIQEGRTVYVVEGEKDVETLEGMGYCATTCAGGAKNWRAAHSEHLKGADVVVVPDNDESGEGHEQLVVDNTRPVAKSVRVVHLKDGYPEMPTKGDISDLAELVGADKAKAVLDQLAKAAELMLPDLYSLAQLAYNRLPGYCVKDGCTCQQQEDATKTLCTFVALPIREINRDDGITQTKQLEIAGWSAAGHRLPTICLDITKLRGMDWPMDHWGLTANIMPGTTVRDKLRCAITSAGAQVAERRTIYQHMGWRYIAGKWRYLYQGGCIGGSGINVDMGPGLEAYTLDAPADVSPKDAALTSLSTSVIMDPRVSVPMLGITYLAPLREFLMQAGNPPSFAVVLKGGTGTRKSTAAALFLSHFGMFSNTSLPASFSDTVNYVRSKAFYVKDAPLVVDDYYPATSRDEKRQMQRIAQLLSRAFGDNRERGRLGADLSIQRSQPPRALGIITGELVPDIGESGVGRFYVIEVSETYVPAEDALTDLQIRARDGELRAAMRSYIEWLQPQADTLPKVLGDMFYEYRKKAEKLVKGSGAHSRTPEQIAHIMIGLTMMERWAAELFKDSQSETIDVRIAEYWRLVTGNSLAQTEASRDDTPVNMFMQAVTELIASKAVQVMDITMPDGKSVVPKDMCGYVDGMNYYLMPDTIYGMVVKFYSNQERVLPGNKAELYRALRTAGIIQQTGSDGKTTRQKRTPDGKNQRLLWIPRWRLDGTKEPPPSGLQVPMDLEPVDDPDLPDGWKEEKDEDEST